MGQWITSPERIIQPFQTVNEVTWTFNLLEAMEFVGILCMSMWLTTFFFTPKIRKVTQMLVSFITVNNSSLKNQPNNGDLLTDIRTKTTWICAYVIWTPHQYFMELHSIGINYQIGPAIWIITIYLSISILIWIVLCTTQLFYLSVSVSVSLFLCLTYFFSKWSSLYPRRFLDCSTYSFCGWNDEHVRQLFDSRSIVSFNHINVPTTSFS